MSGERGGGADGGLANLHVGCSSCGSLLRTRISRRGPRCGAVSQGALTHRESSVRARAWLRRDAASSWRPCSAACRPSSSSCCSPVPAAALAVTAHGTPGPDRPRRHAPAPTRLIGRGGDDVLRGRARQRPADRRPRATTTISGDAGADVIIGGAGRRHAAGRRGQRPHQRRPGRRRDRRRRGQRRRSACATARSTRSPAGRGAIASSPTRSDSVAARLRGRPAWMRARPAGAGRSSCSSTTTRPSAARWPPGLELEGFSRRRRLGRARRAGGGRADPPRGRPARPRHARPRRPRGPAPAARRRRPVPVCILSARDEVDDRVRGPAGRRRRLRRQAVRAGGGRRAPARAAAPPRPPAERGAARRRPARSIRAAAPPRAAGATSS